MTRHWHIDVEELARLWRAGVPAGIIARKFGVTTHQVYRLREQYGIEDREKVVTKDPTPAQIAERAAALRERHLAEMRALG